MMPAATFPTPFRLALLPLLLTLAACSGSGEAASAGEHAATASTGDSTPAIASAAAPAAATVASTPAATAGTTEAAATPAAEAPRATAAAAAPAARVSEAHEPAAAEAAGPFPLPQGAHRYRFDWDGHLEGSATRTLSCQQETCTLRTEASVVGVASMTESTRFSWQGERIRFEQYDRKLQLLFVPQVARITRQNNGLIRTERKGKTRTYKDSPTLVDALGLEVQLRADLVRTGSIRKQYTVADTKGPVDVVIEELPKEKLTIAGKSMEARVFRRRSEDGTRVTTLWMDPAQAYLTVQALHRDEGNTYRLNWLGN